MLTVQTSQPTVPAPSATHLPIGVLLADDGLSITYVNQTFLAAFECNATDLLDREFIDLIAPSDRRSAVALDRELSRPQTEVVDRLLLLAIDKVEHFVRAKIVRRSEQQWQVLVEVLDDGPNTVYQLYSEQLQWSAAIRHTSDAVVIVDDAHRVIDFNERFFEMIGQRSDHGVLVGEEALRGTELWSLDSLSGSAGNSIRLALSEKSVDTSKPIELGERWYETNIIPLRTPQKRTRAHAILLRDVTDRRRSEHERMLRQRERLAHQNDIIASQRKAIRDLSAPLLPIARDVLVVPFIGSLERDRLREITDSVMTGVQARGSKVVILDLTGVPTLDRGAAQGLVATARTLRLIGARTILTGLNPNLAVILIDEQVSLDELEIRSNLQDAVGSVLKHRARSSR